MPYAKTDDGTKLYYKDWGLGRPVILIHGWPLSADGWDDVAIPIVEAGFRTIAYDRRGFGRSEQPWSGYDYDTLADDLAAVIAATGVTDATIVGFSMGGGEVARYLTRHGSDKIAQAVLVSSVVPYMPKTDDNPDGTPTAAFEGMSAGMTKDRAAFFAGFFKVFFGVGLVKHPVSDQVVENACNVAMQASLKATLACAQAFSSTDFRPDLASFTVPTLIIHGTEDKTVPIDPAGRAAARGIPGSTLIEYDNEPHGVFATQKERLASDLIHFLRS